MKKVKLIFYYIIFVTIINNVNATLINVTSYGAVCDGSTDDASSVQAAFNALGAGDTLLIPGMSAIGSSGISLSAKSDVTILGSSSAAGFKALAVTGGGTGVGGFGPIMFRIYQCENCLVKGLTFEGSNLDVVPLGLGTCVNVIIENNTVQNTGYANAGIVSTTGYRNVFRGNTINKTKSIITDGARGMWLGNTSLTETEWYPLVENNTLTEIAATGIVVSAVSAQVINNTVDSTLGAGIKYVPRDGYMDTTIIEGNILSRNYFHGIQIHDGDGTYNCYNTVMKNNIIDKSNEAGIHVFANINNGVISGNTITNSNTNGSANGWAGGIWIHAANGLEISGNNISDDRGSNKLQDNSIVLAASYNAAQGHDIINVIVKNNICSNNIENGLVLVGRNEHKVDGVIIENNTFENNGKYGLHIDELLSGQVFNVSGCGNVFNNNSIDLIKNNTSYPFINPVCITGITEDVSDNLFGVIYSNPFNSNFTLKYEIKEMSTIEITLFDLTGRVCYSSILNEQPRGSYMHSITDLENNLSHGMFFCELRYKSKEGAISNKVIKLIKQ